MYVVSKLVIGGDCHMIVSNVLGLKIGKQSHLCTHRPSEGLARKQCA